MSVTAAIGNSGLAVTGTTVADGSTQYTVTLPNGEVVGPLTESQLNSMGTVTSGQPPNQTTTLTFGEPPNQLRYGPYSDPATISGLDTLFNVLGPVEQGIAQGLNEEKAETNQPALAAQNQTAGDAGANPSSDISSDSENEDQDQEEESTPEPLTEEEEDNIDNSDENASTNASSIPLVPQALAQAQAQSQGVENPADISEAPVPKNLGGNKQNSFTANPNPLDAFVTYTYGLTLHVLTREDYNTLTENPTKFKPTRTLISSAGRYNSKSVDASGNTLGQRDPEFKDDFYFENFKMETVVGANAGSKGTNAISMDFTIIEPYGMTLVDRIMHVNNVGLNGKNYLDMPYLLEISFFGADNSGKMQKIADQTKWIPIKLMGLKIKASVKGSEYAIQAVPFNHAANFETVQSIKTRMHVTATTVGDYFANSSDTNLPAQVDSIRESSEWSSGKKGAGGGRGGGAATYGVAPAAQSDGVLVASANTISTQSFTAAYNAWFLNQFTNGAIKSLDQIAFDIDPQIATSTIVDAKRNSTRKVASTDPNATAKGAEGYDAVTADFDSIVHDLEPGTTVTDVINNILTQSQYFLSQVTDSSQQQKESQTKSPDQASVQEQATPTKTWKIVPSIKLGSFDAKRNQWSKTITFHIKPYTVYQTRDDRLPKSPPPNPVKRYDYLYTGHNSSVINFDIDFNALYYTAMETDTGATTAGTGPKQQEQDAQNNTKTQSETDTNNIQPIQKSPESGNQEASSGGAIARTETQNAKSALQSIYTTAGADMINLKMQIIGDPEFIKQDDLFINPSSQSTNPVNGTATPDNSTSPYVPGTRSLDMDGGEIYCYVTFRTPSDFNQETGMYDLNSKNKYSVSEFSGYYRVLTVTNEFSNGKFNQTLNMVRVDQKSPNSNTASSDTTSAGDKQRENLTAKEMAQARLTNNPTVPENSLNPAVEASNWQSWSKSYLENYTATAPNDIADTFAARENAGPDGDAWSNYYSEGAGAATVAKSTAQQSADAWQSWSNQSAAPDPDIADVAGGTETFDISDLPSSTQAESSFPDDDSSALA